MPKCAIKRGFLILTECKQETSKICPACGRPACEDHLVYDDNGRDWLCVDCHGRLEKKERLSNKEAINSRSWNHGYRDRYYRDHRYSPYYYGSYYHSYYDDYDMRAFDSDMSDTPELTEDDSGPDFMDS